MLAHDYSNLSESEQFELIALLEAEDKFQRNKMYETIFKSFYDWQDDFVTATAKYHECCLCAANQIGKTYTGTTIDAIHLLGDYPEEWKGHKFTFAPVCWGLGFSMEKTRDLLQTALFGKYTNGEFEGGLVPSNRIVSWESATGTPNAMRTVRVKHVSGELSVIQFWSYSQGQHAIMGDVVDWFHIDEEPRDQTIRPQVLTRTINGDRGDGGRGIYTFTPENGRTDLVIQFMDTPSKNQFFMRKGWDDAPHMTEEKKTRLLAQYPAHQREMRTKGLPMLGHGRIYDIAEEDITCDPFDIPSHFKVIGGMDFGYDHPQAQVKLAWDLDNDIIYVTNAWKKDKCSANDAFGAVKSWQKDVPVAWPHDGLMHEKGRDDAKQQKDHYEDAGFNMLSSRATWDGTSNSVEQGIYEIRERMLTGKFKIFRGCRMAIDELLQYHRDDKGKIVKVFDDILDAIRYAYMMKRYAVAIGEIGQAEKQINFASIF